MKHQVTKTPWKDSKHKGVNEIYAGRINQATIQRMDWYGARLGAGWPVMENGHNDNNYTYIETL